MKALKLFLLLFLFFFVGKVFAQENVPFKFRFQIEGEKLVKQIEKAYFKKDYKKVVSLAKKIPIIFYLRPEENLIIADSYLKTGYPEEAIKYANRVISVKRGTFEACKAKFIKLEALSIMNKLKELKKELKTFRGSFCNKLYLKKIQTLLYYLRLSQQQNIDQSLLAELYKIKCLYLLNTDRLTQARDAIFYYINVFQKTVDAPELIFRLAEGYFKKNKRAQAEVLYKLIITQWDGTKQALFSKFRLYQIAYDKILVKELVPKKMIEDLIFYITEIKTVYPNEKIAEDAQIFEIKLYRDMKNYRMLRRAFKSFIKRYSKSSFIKEASRLYCEALTNILESDYKNKKLEEIFEIEKKDKPYIKTTKCGTPYYILGNVLLDYNFYDQSAYNFITAYDLGVFKKYQPDLILKLCLTAFETGENDLFKELFAYLIANYKEKILKKDPYYFYLASIYQAYNKNLAKADYYLNLCLKTHLPEFYKEKLLRFLRDRAIALEDYERALEYTNISVFKAQPEDYILLLLKTFYKKTDVFEKVLKVSEEKFPKNTTIKWIEAYYLERKGEVKEADKLWKSLIQGSKYENELAKSYEKLKGLVEKFHEFVY